MPLRGVPEHRSPRSSTRRGSGREGVRVRAGGRRRLRGRAGGRPRRHVPRRRHQPGRPDEAGRRDARPCSWTSPGCRSADVLETDGGLLIGAAVRNSELAADPAVRRSATRCCPARCSPARPGSCATRPRSAATCCSAPAAATSRTSPSPATSGNPARAARRARASHRDLAILGTSEHCVATHPSDLAVALAALDAVVHAARAGRRSAVTSLHRLPGRRTAAGDHAPGRRADHRGRGAGRCRSRPARPTARSATAPRTRSRSPRWPPRWTWRRRHRPRRPAGARRRSRTSPGGRTRPRRLLRGEPGDRGVVPGRAADAELAAATAAAGQRVSRCRSRSQRAHLDPAGAGVMTTHRDPHPQDRGHRTRSPAGPGTRWSTRPTRSPTSGRCSRRSRAAPSARSTPAAGDAPDTLAVLWHGRRAGAGRRRRSRAGGPVPVRPGLLPRPVRRRGGRRHAGGGPRPPPARARGRRTSRQAHDTELTWDHPKTSTRRTRSTRAYESDDRLRATWTAELAASPR